MKSRLYKGFKVLLTAAFLCSAGLFLYRSIQMQKGAMIYAEAEKLAKLPEGLTEAGDKSVNGEPLKELETTDSENPWQKTLEEIDLAALQEVNDDVLGWILIPDTQLSYPLVQGEDNEFYLERTWEGEPGSVGAIFLEQANRADLSDFHTIVYGHRMLDGSMFGSLKHYSQQEYADSHPYIYIVDGAGSHCYEIFAAYETPVTGNTYQMDFPEEEEQQKFLNDCLTRSVIDTGVVPTIRDRILTLSTCTGRGYESRWVVQARLEEASQNTIVE